MNKRRAARQKRNKKKKAKGGDDKPGEAKKDSVKAKGAEAVKQPQQKSKGRSKAKATIKKKANSKQVTSPQVNSSTPNSDPRISQANMWSQMPEHVMEQIQLLTQRLAMVESGRGSIGEFKDQTGHYSTDQFSTEPMLPRTRTSYGGNTKKGPPLHGGHRTMSNIELMSKSELGRIKEEAEMCPASPANVGKMPKKKKRRRERIKSYDGKMIPVNLATGDELIDKLSMVVYFHGAKGRGQKPLVITVDKEWNFKTCMRKAIAEMQKRPETTQNEELNWILHYDVNSQDGIKAIRTDLRVLMGDHRIEHRGSHLNHKPADYTDQFVNKLWIIPNKGAKLPTGLPRASVSRRSRINSRESLQRESLQRESLLDLTNRKYNL